MKLTHCLREKKLIICCGVSGAGKTTASCAIALRAAQRGRRVLTVTIDPSARLARSLGLSLNGNDETDITEQARAEGLRIKGSLHVTVLDTKKTFDQLIRRHAPGERARSSILANRLYQDLSTSAPGVQEYMEMEKLYELFRAARYDLIVLDTPATSNALEFLEAPDRMTDFLDRSTLGRLLRRRSAAANLGVTLLQRGSYRALRALEAVTGLRLMSDLLEFLMNFEHMYDGFKERAEKVGRILRDEETAFLLISRPDTLAVDEALFFYSKLKDFGMPFACHIVNKLHNTSGPESRGIDRKRLPDDGKMHRALMDSASKCGFRKAETLSKKLIANFHDFYTLAEVEKRNVQRLRRITKRSVTLVPCLELEVCDLLGLNEMNRFLFS